MPQGTLGNVCRHFGCHSWVVGASGTQWVEARGADKHPVIHGVEFHDRVTQPNVPSGLQWRSMGKGGAKSEFQLEHAKP